MFTVLIADDHPVFRDGMRSIIEKAFDMAEVTEVGDMMGVRGALSGDTTFDLLVLDVYFPGFEVARDLAKLRRDLALTPIAVVSMVSNKDMVKEIMSLGVNGFISKSVAPEIIAGALKAIADGEVVVRQSSGPQIAEAMQPDPLACLTPRQLDALTLICQGMSNKEIARKLDLSPYTVRVHVSAMMAALNVHSRSAAAALGSSLGLS